MTFDEILNYAAKARESAVKSESAIWAAGTKYTAADLETGYESYIITELEDNEDPDSLLGFGDWCEQRMGIANE